MNTMQSNLLLHCGANVVSIDDVAKVVEPEPSETHVPIPHIRLYEEAFNHVVDAGLRIKQEVHALHTKKGVEGANYFALMEVESDRPDYNLIIGLRNSHIKEYAASFVLGSRVFVCDNLAFSGEVKLSRKHTKHIANDLPQVMARAVAKLITARVSQDERIMAYRATPLELAAADHLLMNMVRANVIAPSKILPAAKEFERPSHEEFLSEDGSRTVWTLFNAVTETYKGTSVFTLPRRGDALHGICDTACGIGIDRYGEDYTVEGSLAA